MKICFIWVNKFRNFEDFGCNLSSSFKFRYDSFENTIYKNTLQKLPESFFGPRVKDVIGIVGKNGAGKSNAVELVCKILKGAKTSLQTDFLIIVEENNVLKCYYSLPFGLKPKANFDVEILIYEGNLNPLKVVFFSNVFDERRNDFTKEISDISVNSQFQKGNILRRENMTNFEKQIKLINSKFFPSLNIDLPKKVQITSKVWIKSYNSIAQRQGFGYEYLAVQELKTVFRDRIRDIRPENKFVHLLRFGFFLNWYRQFYKGSRLKAYDNTIQSDNLHAFILSILDFRTEEISDHLLDFLEADLRYISNKYLDLSYNNDEVSNNNFEEKKILKQLYFLKELKFTISNLKVEYDSEGSRNREFEYFTFDYESNSSRKFIHDYIALFGHLGDFNINWLGISSGHKAYLNLFASLYQELRFTRIENMLLCIDEGDLYLHPKWQVEFFDKLVKVLPLIYSGSIQLILTSHSPFLLSDLPNQNITILDKEKSGYAFNGTDLSIETFGGNLYDLYSEPFFLGSKRTSDFAYSKIKNAIQLAESKNLTEKQKQQVLKIASLIGDEVIQFRIKKLLNDD